MHSPDHVEAAAEARRLGGLQHRKEATIAIAYDFDGLDTMPGIRRLLDIAAHGTLSLENSVNRNRLLTNIAHVAANLYEKSILEERLTAMENLLKPRLPKPSKQGRR